MIPNSIKDSTKNSKSICVDASLWVRLLAKEGHFQETDDFFLQWIDEGDFFLAPSFLIFELVSSLCKKYKHGQLTDGGVEEGLKRFFKMPILLYQSETFMAETWRWTRLLGETVAYDVSYLALADWKKVPFYTADERFYEKAKGVYADCHLV